MSAGLLESLLGKYEDSKMTLPGANLAWVGTQRDRAVAALVNEGLPGSRSEAWKYTSLRALEQRQYAAGDADAATRPIDIAALALPGLNELRIVFVNGALRADLSNFVQIPGLAFESLSTALSNDTEALRSSFDRAFSKPSAAFAQLNMALMADGPVLRVSAGAHIATPIYIVFIGAPAQTDIAWHARSIIELSDGAELTIVEHHLAVGANANLGNHVAQYILGRGANLQLVQLQGSAENATLVRRDEVVLGETATLSMHALEIGAQLMRHEIDIELQGAHAHVACRGVFALRGRQHADIQLAVTHSGRDTVSDVFWRGIADQRGRGVFRGAISVVQGADGADAKLSNKNLLLSPHAEIDTQPVLEIYVDEVKASHGATVGQLDEQALFYLRSRGLSAIEARQLLTYAFCREALATIPITELRTHIEALLLAHLPQSIQSM